MKKAMAIGTLYLFPVPLAPDAVLASIPAKGLALINEIDEYIVENPKTARRFLKEMGLKTPQADLILHDYGKHQRDKVPSKSFLAAALSGKSLGLMSEAGCPGIADPGAEIVAEAHRLGIPVVPLVGPSSILLALMGSGFNGQQFAFHGYLPIEKKDRANRVVELEKESATKGQTQLFIETPFRNESLLAELIRLLKPSTRLCVAMDLTAPTEQIISKTVQQWKTTSIGAGNAVELHKRPAIFLLLASK